MCVFVRALLCSCLLFVLVLVCVCEWLLVSQPVCHRRGPCDGVVVSDDGSVDVASAAGPRQYIHGQSFGPSVPQPAVYASVNRGVPTALALAHACVIAYGAPGSGKTFTMFGEGLSCVRVLFLLVVRLCVCVSVASVRVCVLQ